MREVFYVKSCSYVAGVKVTAYLKKEEEKLWTVDINEAQEFTSYPSAQTAITAVISEGDHLQIEKYFVM